MSFWGSVAEMFRIDAAPLSEEDRRFVEEAFRLFAREFSWAPLQATVVVPTARFFPRDWNGGDDEELAELFAKLCRAMAVDAARVRITVFGDDDDPVKRLVPNGESGRSGPAGLFMDRSQDDRFVIGVALSQLENAGSLVATIAHELAHVHLLGDRRLSRDDPDHERLTDLLVVFFGLGIFTANSAFQFRGRRRGWETQRLGYLDEPVLGHALACYAHARGEIKPSWAEYLAPGISVYLKRSLRELAAEKVRVLPLVGTEQNLPGTEA